MQPRSSFDSLSARGGTSTPAQQLDLIRALAQFLFLATFGIAVTIPHSLQTATAALMVLTAAVSVLVMRSQQTISYVGVCYGISVAVTCLYLLVGMMAGAPMEAVIQTVAVYVLSPLLWIIILRTAIQNLGIERLTRYAILLTAVCCLTVAIFFFLYFTFGAGSVGFFMEEANIYVGQGFAGATMRVYGSLIFLAAATFAVPDLIKNMVARVSLMGAVAICALTSGRAALILAIPIGFLIGVLIRRRNPHLAIESSGGGFFRYLLYILGVLPFAVVLDYFIEGIDIWLILQGFWQKLTEGGGSERVEQTSALIDGIWNTYGLGAGHGIGVGVERNALYPWRYENVLVATLFRVGFLGALAYVAVFLIYLGKVAKAFIAGTLDRYQIFMFGGFVAVVLAAPTNPYLESFIFQWMFILPLIAFDVHATNTRRQAQRLAQPA